MGLLVGTNVLVFLLDIIGFKNFVRIFWRSKIYCEGNPDYLQALSPKTLITRISTGEYWHLISLFYFGIYSCVVLYFTYDFIFNFTFYYSCFFQIFCLFDTLKIILWLFCFLSFIGTLTIEMEKKYREECSVKGIDAEV